LSLQAQITARLRDALVAMVSAVQVIPTQVSLDPDQEYVFAHMCKVICEEFLPFVRGCFDAVFRSPQSLVDISPLVESLSRLYITSIPQTEEILDEEELSTENGDQNNSEIETDASRDQLNSSNNTEKAADEDEIHPSNTTSANTNSNGKQVDAEKGIVLDYTPALTAESTRANDTDESSEI